MKLPSFNKRQFIAHIKRGPGFGCWKQSRIDRAWGKKPRRVTAKDVAHRLLRTSTEHHKQAYMMLSMLSQEAMLILFKNMGVIPPFNPNRASGWAWKLTLYKSHWAIAHAIIAL